MSDTRTFDRSTTRRIRASDTSRRADSGTHVPASAAESARAQESTRLIRRLRCMPEVRTELVESTRLRVNAPGYDLDGEFARAMDIMARQEFGL